MGDGIVSAGGRARRLTTLLLAGSVLGGIGAPASAQRAIREPARAAPVATLAPTPAPDAVPSTSGTVRSISVRGVERLETTTVRSYINLKPGDSYDRDLLDRALKALYATELFADVRIKDDEGALTVEVRENPVINRIVLEGNKHVKEDKIRAEIKLAPRQIFTRSKVRADVARIDELYRRQGRFAASVEPKIVQLDQNRVDLVYEIHEGDKSKIRQINIIGNEHFSDKEIRSQMATKQDRFFRFFSSNNTYDPDRMAYDQQKMRQFYLTQGYADFRVVSAVAELTPDRRDFIVTYVVDEGDRYKFGDVKMTSQIRDVKAENFIKFVPIKKGDWYNAKRTEDTLDSLTETVGLLGYAFADIRPQFDRDKANKVMNLTFNIAEAPRVYVEHINIAGNTLTKDRVVRREFRLAEGDAFNSVKVKRTKDRIQSLGYFQEKLDIDQKQGSSPDKVDLNVNVEEKATGQLQVSAGYSSLEKFIVSLSIEQRNFRGMAQQLRASVSYSTYSKSAEAGFTEPYLFGRNLALGGDIFRRDLRSFGYGVDNDRQTIYNQTSTGFQIRTTFPITEFWASSFRYGLSHEEVNLSDVYFNDVDGDGIGDKSRANCIAGIYICESYGNYTISAVGYSLAFDNTNNRVHPSHGQRFVFSQDVAGVGGGEHYIRSSSNAAKYWALGRSGFIFSTSVEGGYIFGWNGDDIRLTDRYFLGEPQFAGFGIRGIGPRSIQRVLDPTTGQPTTSRKDGLDTALGGSAYYLGRLELEIPLGSGGRELGLRPSIFANVGSLWDPGKRRNGSTTTTSTSGGVSTTLLDENLGDTPTPRVSVGLGVNWNSPFGPFRIDVAKALKKVEGDNTQIFQFNVGTQF